MPSSCRVTMTSLRARQSFLCHQLTSTAMFLVQLMQALLKHPVLSFDALNVPEVLDAIRTSVVKAKTDETMYNTFYNSVTSKYTHMMTLVRLVASTTVDFLCIHDHVDLIDGELVVDPIHSLYQFLLRLAYTSPCLFFARDNASGDFFVRLKAAISDEFVSEIISIKAIKSTLTHHALCSSLYTTDDKVHDDYDAITEEPAAPLIAPPVLPPMRIKVDTR